MEINAYTFCVILIFLPNFFQSFIMMFFSIFHFLPFSLRRTWKKTLSSCFFRASQKKPNPEYLYLSTSVKELSNYMQIVSVTPYNVNGGKQLRPQMHSLFLSVFRCLRNIQVTYMKFAECINILELIIYAKFKNDRTKGMPRARKWKRIFFSRMISAVCISLLCYSTMSTLLPSIVRDTDNIIIIFVQ